MEQLQEIYRNSRVSGEGNGTFRAADARTGASLFTYNAPANIPNAGGAAAGPVTYLADGREFIFSPSESLRQAPVSWIPRIVRRKLSLYDKW
jgi:hypothetical protein